MGNSVFGYENKEQYLITIHSLLIGEGEKTLCSYQ